MEFDAVLLPPRRARMVAQGFWHDRTINDDLDACLAALDFIGRAGEAPRAIAAGLAETAPPEQATGQLGDYRLIREVGRGGMGVVYEAEQISLGRRVALKVLPFAATMDQRQRQRFQNEARAAASLDHPHIVPVHGVGCERGVHYYAMQLIEGRSLAAVIEELRGPSSSGGDPYSLKGSTGAFGESGESGASCEPAPTAPVAALSTRKTGPDKAHFRHVAELVAQVADALEYEMRLDRRTAG